MIPDQKQLWNRKHSTGEHEDFRSIPSSFARGVEPKFARRSKILELGCGIASDSVYFAQQGHTVLASDLSDTVIKRDKQLFADKNLKFAVLDMSKPLEFADDVFDVVYAHLSLHYYSQPITRAIFDEIARVVKSRGLFAFACKTHEDPKYGKGQEVEPDLFVSETGHVRHFFTKTYAEELLLKNFETVSLTEMKETYVDTYSAFIWCIAMKK